MEQLCGKSGKADNAGFSNTGLHVRLAFAGPVSRARRSAVARSSSELARPLGLKHFRPLLRTVVDGEDHDTLLLDAISDDKGGIRNDQLTGAADTARSP